MSFNAEQVRKAADAAKFPQAYKDAFVGALTTELNLVLDPINAHKLNRWITEGIYATVMFVYPDSEFFPALQLFLESLIPGDEFKKMREDVIEYFKLLVI